MITLNILFDKGSNKYRKSLKHIDEMAKFLAVIVDILPKCIAPAPNIYYVAKEL